MPPKAKIGSPSTAKATAVRTAVVTASPHIVRTAVIAFRSLGIQRSTSSSAHAQPEKTRRGRIALKSEIVISLLLPAGWKLKSAQPMPSGSQHPIDLSSAPRLTQHLATGAHYPKFRSRVVSQE